MDYPSKFSGRARANVEREQLRASRDLIESRRKKAPDEWKRTAREWDRCAFYAYILRVFLAFAHECCELGRAGVWTLDQVRAEANEFLRRFTIHAYYEKGHDRSGEKFRDMTSNWNGSLLSEVRSEFESTQEWRQFEDELLDVAEHVAGSIPDIDRAGSPRVEPNPQTAMLREPIPTGNQPDVAAVPEWASDLDTPAGRKRAREGWKQNWTTEDRECTNGDLTETAFNQKDSPFLNQWENGTMRLKDPGRSSRVQAIERVLRANTPPKWHPMAKKTR